MYTLHKLSAPGWDKEFSTIEALRDELEKYVCKSCWTDNALLDYDGIDLGIIDINEYNEMSTLDQVGALLWTSCGCEFDVDEDLRSELGVVTSFAGKTLGDL